MSMLQPSPNVLNAFGLRDPHLSPAPRGWGGGVLAGPIVLTPVADRARATWSARVRDTLDPSGIRIARPFRATDGRTIVGDWRAGPLSTLPGWNYCGTICRTELELTAACGLILPQGWSFTSSLQTYEKMSTLLPKLSTETCCLEHCLSQEVPHWSPILCPTGTTRLGLRES